MKTRNRMMGKMRVAGASTALAIGLANTAQAGWKEDLIEFGCSLVGGAARGACEGLSAAICVAPCSMTGIWAPVCEAFCAAAVSTAADCDGFGDWAYDECMN